MEYLSLVPMYPIFDRLKLTFITIILLFRISYLILPSNIPRFVVLLRMI
ncbi:unnamed protein product [Onchocerca flexuosa]|uniref:Uncharacterized protein n=1 Tax=Onchocerca flexuosa TaxID=387005 RepID=A0A183HX44_9BILA|nr:unnamed protein product [Onchocerca flexuosa]